MWLSELNTIAGKKVQIIAGLMSGTSADGVDVALCEVRSQDGTPSIKLLDYITKPYSNVVREKILKADTLNIKEIAELDVAIGREFSEALKSLLKKRSIQSSEIDLIGSHGQTIYHHSRNPGSLKSTLQLGCADTISIETGCFVFYDFRRKDIVLGGEGAPLTPYADYYLYGKSGVRRGVLNLGGIANLTVLGSTLDDIFGFDTGPANAPLDRLAVLFSNGKETCDRDGKFAASGKVDSKLLSQLLQQDTFLPLPPPKSTGFEAYGDSFVRYLVGLHSKIDADLIRTVTEFIGITIGESLKRHVSISLDELILAGGGAHNPILKDSIARNIAPTKVVLSDDVGVPSDAREAMAFALFAHDALMGRPTSLPRVTGVQRHVCLGKLAFPQ